jgi:5-formyltetrahydrofolate cyclo-ligase
MLSKSHIRKQILEQRDRIESKKKAEWDRGICDCLFQKIGQSTRVLHTFLPMGNEIDLYPVIRWALGQKITVVTPRALKNREMEHLVLHSLDELEEGIYGTRHPANSEVYRGNYDAIIVPGLAFNSKGERLGYGGGYYDRFLRDQPSATTIGVCYPFQQLDVIPTEPHDMTVKTICSAH